MSLAGHIYAEALAASLAPPDAFRRHERTISEQAVMASARKAATAYAQQLHLQEIHARKAIRNAFGRWRHDALRHANRDDAPSTELHRIIPLLCNAASALFQPDGREFILAVDREEPGQEILRWRFVSLAMPASNLLAAAAARFGRTPPATVRLLHRSMAPGRPVAQQHLHHAAAISFEEIWASLRLRALLEPSGFRRSLRDKRAWCPGLHAGRCERSRHDGKKQAAKMPEQSARHMDEWADLLLNAFIARGLLRCHAGHPQPLRDCEHEHCRRGWMTLHGFLHGCVSRRGVGGTPYPWREDRFEVAARWRKAMAPDRFRRSQEPRRALIRQQAAEERGILTQAFRCAEGGCEDYELLLLQYLRIKTALHKVLVHSPAERGLDSFLDHFLQIKVYEPKSDRLRPARPVEPGLDVAATEYRMAPDAWLATLGEREGEIEDVAPGQASGDAAWLIHFKRSGAEGRLPLFGRAVREMDLDARRIANALEQKPERLNRLRGIDICGVEEAQPLWVSAETLRYLRLRSCDIASRRPRLKLQPLRLTLHAGEDFSWLTSGTRAIAEPLAWKLIERGDRIGHGIAVTLDPRGWWERHSGQAKECKRIDRLWDLAFLASYTEELAGARDDEEGRFAAARTGEQQEWLEQAVRSTLIQLDLIGKDDEASSAFLLQEAKSFWKGVGTRTGRRLLQQPDAPPGGAALHRHWLHRYFWSRNIQRRGEQRVTLTPNDGTFLERDLLVKARARLIRELARWQIPIESNPSSNLVVASLDAMASQDFLAQSSHKKRGPGEETLPWTISTDDPITFATSLADEYAYAWAGMVLREKAPFDPAHARALLEEAAATSMRTRFTLPDPDVA